MKKEFKQFIGECKANDEERTITAVISTSSVDRQGEVVVAKGVDLEKFMKNPVVLWAHNYSSTPIGKTIFIDKKRKALIAKFKVADTEKAEEIYQLYKDGFLSAFSIGFSIKKSHKPTPEEIKKRPEWADAWRIIDEWELLEFSAVPVPANPEALTVAVKGNELHLSKETSTELGIKDEDNERVYMETETSSAIPTTVIKVDINLDEELDKSDPIELKSIPISLEPVGISLRDYEKTDIKNNKDEANRRLKLKARLSGKAFFVPIE